MFAKQTRMSASLVAVLAGGGSSVRAYAAPDDPLPPAPSANDEAPPPHPSGSFLLGAGWNVDDGFLAHARVAQDNLFGTGHQLALDATLSERRQLFVMSYLDPHLADSDFALGANLFNDQLQLPGFTRTAIGAGVSLSHPLGDHLRGFIGYRVRDVAVTLDAVARGETVPPGSTTISSLYSGLEYNSLDAPYQARHGTRIGASFEVADPRLGSEVELSTIRAWAETHQALGPFTVHVGGSVAAIGGPHGVPLSERFFLTSSYQVRGFAPGEIGPANGGTLQAFGRAELEVPLIPSIGLSGHGFLDAGAIYDGGTGGIGRSAGYGFVWRSPIGPLVFDWAFPLTGNGPMRFVFGLGAMF